MNITTRIPKLFLTAQTVNPPRFPLHVPNENIADNIRLTSRYSAGSYAFAVKGLCAWEHHGKENEVTTRPRKFGNHAVQRPPTRPRDRPSPHGPTHFLNFCIIIVLLFLASLGAQEN